MIKVTVLYPNTEGSRFDMAYYCDRHIPMVRQKLGAACAAIEVEQGMRGAQPGSRAPFVAMARLVFDSDEAFQNAFRSHAQAILADIANYTDIDPIIQVNEVKT